jgi:hypothetical protein
MGLTHMTPIAPLDTWVWVLAAIALIFGAIQLYRQQKIHSKI